MSTVPGTAPAYGGSLLSDLDIAVTSSSGDNGTLDLSIVFHGRSWKVRVPLVFLSALPLHLRV